MRIYPAIVLIACAFVLAVEIDCNLARPGEQGKPTPKSIAIPLRSIYCTSGQEGLKQLAVYKRDEPLAEIEKGHHRRMINLFLVQGKDIKDAVNTAHRVYVGNHSASHLVHAENGAKGEDVWLAGYLGVGGAGTQWVIQSVERKGNVIRMAYEETPGSSALIVVKHYYWAPIGKLDRGVYRLELFDAKSKEITLGRRVVVP